MNQHLKPCALCGCTKVPVRQGNGIGDYWLECTDCGMSTRPREDGDGIKDWNRRPDASESAAVGDEREVRNKPERDYVGMGHFNDPAHPELAPTSVHDWRSDIRKVINALDPEDWCGDEPMITALERALAALPAPAAQGQAVPAASTATGLCADPMCHFAWIGPHGHDLPRTPLPPASAASEPVAEVYSSIERGDEWDHHVKRVRILDEEKVNVGDKLYLHPPASPVARNEREALTDAQIMKLWPNSAGEWESMQIVKFARALLASRTTD